MTKQKEPIAARDGALESPWQAGITQPILNNSTDTVYDVLVVGGGITGMTAALLLQEVGKPVLIADA